MTKLNQCIIYGTKGLREEYYEEWGVVSDKVIQKTTLSGHNILYAHNLVKYVIYLILTFWKPADTGPSFCAAVSSSSTFSRPLLTACISSAKFFSWIYSYGNKDERRINELCFSSHQPMHKLFKCNYLGCSIKIDILWMLLLNDQDPSHNPVTLAFSRQGAN